MSDSVLVLDYELSLAELRSHLRRLGRSPWVVWARRFFALLSLWGAAQALQAQDKWEFVVSVIFALIIGAPHGLITWSGLWLWRRNRPSPQVRLEVDEVGLRLTVPSTEIREYFWWSRLTNVNLTRNDYEMCFDNRSYPTLIVPYMGFTDISQRDQFLAMIDRRLAGAEPRAVA